MKLWNIFKWAGDDYYAGEDKHIGVVDEEGMRKFLDGHSIEDVTASGDFFIIEAVPWDLQGNHLIRLHEASQHADGTYTAKSSGFMLSDEIKEWPLYFGLYMNQTEFPFSGRYACKTPEEAIELLKADLKVAWGETYSRESISEE